MYLSFGTGTFRSPEHVQFYIERFSAFATLKMKIHWRCKLKIFALKLNEPVILNMNFPLNGDINCN